MIPHDQFARLRLAQFLPASEVEELSNWEFLDRIWVGEANGFSEWLRLADDPDVLRCLSLDFDQLPEEPTRKVLETIDLPVRYGMRLAELRGLLGESVGEEHLVSDRVSYLFRVERPSYDIDCTVLNDGGLTYVVVTTPLPTEGRERVTPTLRSG